MQFAMKGRRLEKGVFPERPGDYMGPIAGYTGGAPAVFFLKPNSSDKDAPAVARSIQHVTMPPHNFTEEPDGSLTITASLGDTRRGSTESDGWHGYLTKGDWYLA